MTIADLRPQDKRAVGLAAELLVRLFAHLPSGWHTLEEGLAEVHGSLEPGRISRVALDESGDVVGWIGAIPLYQGHVWELHPLVVRPDRHRQGIGRALVADLECLARERGVGTIFIGTDDENGRTNLFGVDLYPDVLSWAARIEARHPDGEAGPGPGASIARGAFRRVENLGSPQMGSQPLPSPPRVFGFRAVLTGGGVRRG